MLSLAITAQDSALAIGWLHKLTTRFDPVPVDGAEARAYVDVWIRQINERLSALLLWMTICYTMIAQTSLAVEFGVLSYKWVRLAIFGFTLSARSGR